MLKVPSFVIRDMLLRIGVARSGDQDGSGDDQIAEFDKGLLKGRQSVCGRPDIGRGVFWKVRVQLACILAKFLISDWVDIVGSLQGVISAILEGLFAAGPADQVMGGRRLKLR